MTTISNTQLSTIAIAGGTAALPEIEQLSSVIVGSNPSAANADIIQLATIIVGTIGQRYVSLGPAIGLGCWSPCGTLLAQGN